MSQDNNQGDNPRASITLNNSQNINFDASNSGRANNDNKGDGTTLMDNINLSPDIKVQDNLDLKPKLEIKKAQSHQPQ